MGTKKWCIKDAPFYLKLGDRKHDRYITHEKVYEATGKQEEFKGQTWSEIKFIDRFAGDKIGWVQDIYLEDLVEDPVSKGFEVLIPNPTPDSTDAAQYFKWEKPRHVRMCGELCAAFIGGDDIETFLTKWKEMDRSHYRFYVPSDSNTGADGVDNMLKAYGYSGSSTRFKDGLTDPHTGLRMSPGKFQKKLKTHYLIAAIRIKSLAGNIGEGKVGHWVVLDKVFPEGINRGWVEIYNPFPNKRQQYSFSEFIKSCEAEGWTGLWVNRNVPSPGG